MLTATISNRSGLRHLSKTVKFVKLKNKHLKFNVTLMLITASPWFTKVKVKS